jgi:hypothetical protein
VVSGELRLSTGGTLGTLGCTTTALTVKGSLVTAPGTTLSPTSLVLEALGGTSQVQGDFLPQTTVFTRAGEGQVVKGGVSYKDVELRGSHTFLEPVSFGGHLNVTGNGALTLNGHRIQVGGNFTLSGSSTLVMTNAEDTLDVRGHTVFGTGDEAGKLITVPYHVEYKAELVPVADLLRRAAELSDNAEFANYLRLRADALLSDDFQPSDLAWMDMKTNPVDIVIGPIESYEDQLFGTKTAYEGVVLVKDMAWSAKLARFAQFLPELQRGADIKPDGSANDKAVAAALAKLLLRVLDRQPEEAVLFLPANQGTRVPVKLADVDIEGKSIGLTVQLMTPAERAELLERIKEPYQSASQIAEAEAKPPSETPRPVGS